MNKLDEARARFPEWKALPDQELADRVYGSFYAGMPRAEFDRKMGLAPSGPSAGERLVGGSAEVAIPERQRLMREALPDWLADFMYGLQGPTSVLEQAVTANLSDEMAGAVGGAGSALAGQGFQSGYDKAAAEERDRVAGFREDHPTASTAIDIAGMAAFAPARIARAVPAAAAARPGLGRRMVGNALVGGGAGAAYGFGAGEGNVFERMDDATEGAAWGAGLGAALPAATAAVAGATAPVVNAVRARIAPQRHAQNLLVNALERSGTDATQVASRMDRALTTTGQRMSVADVAGRDARNLLRTAANVPGADREIAGRAARSAMGQGDRIMRQVDATLAPSGDFISRKNAIMEARATAATPHYNRFYAMPIPLTHDLEEVLSRPAARRALVAARNNAANLNEPWANWLLQIDDAGRLIGARRTPDGRALDAVKRELDRGVESAMAPPDSPFGRPRPTPESQAIAKVREDLLAILDRIGAANGRPGPYAQARATAMDNIQADEALEFGRTAMREDPRMIAARMGTGPVVRGVRPLSPGQRELARLGLAEAVRDAVHKAGLTHNALIRFFGSRDQIARLRAFFPDDAAWRRFRTAMLNEARKADTWHAVRGNSTTAKQLAGMEDAAGPIEAAAGVAGSVARGDIAGAVMRALGAGLRNAKGLTTEVARQLGRMLQSMDSGELQRLLIEVNRIERSRASASVRAGQLRQLVTTVLSSQAGRASADQPSQIPAPL